MTRPRKKPQLGPKQPAGAESNQTENNMAPHHIRHKARQKAIHNARHGRGSSRGEQPPHRQPSGNSRNHHNQNLASQQTDFLASSRFNPIMLDDDTGSSEFDTEELETHRRPYSDNLKDEDLYAAEDVLINVQTYSPLKMNRNVEHRQAEVMFPMREALSIYKGMCAAGFPLLPIRQERFLVRGSLLPSSTSSSAPVFQSSAGQLRPFERLNIDTNGADPGRDYRFDFGKHAGQRFTDVPENYLRTIGGQLGLMDSQHPGLMEAFEYHRPGQGRRLTGPALPLRNQSQQAQSHRSAPRGDPVTQNKVRPRRKPANPIQNRARQRNTEVISTQAFGRVNQGLQS